MGYLSLSANTTGASNTAVGYNALANNTTAADNTAVGHRALTTNTTGTLNTAVGKDALAANTTANGNTGLGRKALAANTTGANNTAVGADALIANTTGSYNVAIGVTAMDAITTGSEAVAIGYAALGAASGGSNVAVGHKALENVTTGTNNIALGKETGRNASAPGGNITTADNQVVIGNNNIANSFIKVDWTVGSDVRDKTDIETLPDNAGLNFVNQMRPVTYVWDNRTNYYDFKNPKYGERDHSKKETRKHTGFIAQEVKEIEESIGWEDDHIVNTSNEHSLTLKYSALIPILTKAIQELSTKVEYLENKLNNK